jgi:hypothetical protein
MSHTPQGHRGTGPGGGQFLPVGHEAAKLSLPERFPHPDSKYPHPMEQWPKGVEEPVRIELGTTEQSLRGHMHNWNDDPQDEKYTEMPAVTITMPNGATLVLQELNEDEFPETEARFEGDWDAYTGGDKFTADEVIDTASETLSQAR